MTAFDIYKLIEMAQFNGLQTMGDLIAFYDRMKQEGESVADTLTRHTKEVLGLE